MKRKQFIKDLVLISGGSIMAACSSRDVLDVIPMSEKHGVDIDEAKNWFESNFLKNVRIGSESMVKRKTIWDFATNILNNKGQNCVLTDIGYQDINLPSLCIGTIEEKNKSRSINDLARVIEKLIVFKDETGKNQAKVLQFILENNNFGKRNELNTNKPFTGHLLVTDWSGEYLDGFYIKNDKYKQKFIFGIKNARVAFSEAVVFTYVYDVYTKQFIATGNRAATLMDYYANSPSDTYTPQITSGGGVNTPIQLNVKIGVYSSEVSNPKLKELIGKVNTAWYKSCLAQKFVDRFFKSDAMDLYLIQTTAMDGIAEFRASVGQSDGRNKVLININKCLYSTKEYVLSVLIHELLHAVIFSDNIFATMNTYEEHRLMMANYLTDLALWIKEITKVSLKDAQALALGGFMDVKNGDSIFFNQQAKRAFGDDFNVGEAIITTLEYEVQEHNRGTPFGQ